MPSYHTLYGPDDHAKHLLAEDHAVLSLVAGSETLLNASVESVLIKYTEEGLAIELALRLRHSTSVPKLLLCFEQVSASFYNVVSYKLLPVEKGYYLSLDPYDETQEVDEKDNDVIIATKVEAYAFVVV
jgi:hypothetical protein